MLTSEWLTEIATLKTAPSLRLRVCHNHRLSDELVLTKLTKSPPTSRLTLSRRISPGTSIKENPSATKTTIAPSRMTVNQAASSCAPPACAASTTRRTSRTTNASADVSDKASRASVPPLRRGLSKRDAVPRVFSPGCFKRSPTPQQSASLRPRTRRGLRFRRGGPRDRRPPIGS